MLRNTSTWKRQSSVWIRFFVQLKVPASLLRGSSLGSVQEWPLTIRMKWLVTYGSRARAVERLLEIPAEMLDACRYYQARHAMLLRMCTDGSPVYAGPTLCASRGDGTSDMRAAEAILRNEAAANSLKWHRMSQALREMFPAARSDYAPTFAMTPLLASVSDDTGAVESDFESGSDCDE